MGGDLYDIITAPDQNHYAAPSDDYECPYDCRGMSTHNFLLYSLMCVALGFFVGVVVGVAAV